MSEWEPTVEELSLGADAINQIATMELDGQEEPNWLIARAVLSAAGKSIEDRSAARVGPAKYIVYPCGEHVGIIYGYLTCPAEEHHGEGYSGELSSPYYQGSEGRLRSDPEEAEEEALSQPEDTAWGQHVPGE